MHQYAPETNGDAIAHDLVELELCNEMRTPGSGLLRVLDIMSEIAKRIAEKSIHEKRDLANSINSGDSVKVGAKRLDENIGERRCEEWFLYFLAKQFADQLREHCAFQQSQSAVPIASITYDATGRVESWSGKPPSR